MMQKLLKVGSSAAVTIPKKSLKELGLEIGDSVSLDIDVKAKQVVIKPALQVDTELIEWTDAFIKQYRTALKQLAKK